MKKVGIMLVTASMMFILGACGKNATTNTATPAASESGTDVEYESETDTEAAEKAQYLVGDSIWFGNYEQDGDTSNGKESIEWLVLDQEDDRILVTSKYVLDCQAYNGEKASVTWEDCTLRAWLNNDFLNNAFNENEQNKIAAMTVTNDDNSESGADGGNDTVDNVFLLSIFEANTYFSSDAERICEPTAYAAEQGAYNNSEQGCFWWLRSPGCDNNSAAVVSYKGSVSSSYGNFVDMKNGAMVRPALWINLE